jgi:hypothetical protein
MVRYNNLKIFINAGDAKPGGNIGAMLSPYLMSTNMLFFCKKFNELSKDYESTVFLNVKINVDIVEKSFTFFINLPNISLIYLFFAKNAFFLSRKVLSILKIYDLVFYASFFYGLNLYKSTKLIFSVIKSFRKRRVYLDFGELFINKLDGFKYYQI